MAFTTNTHHILIVDDVPAVCQALRWLLEDSPDLQVVGEAGDGKTAVSQARRLQPDIVILDIGLPDGDGYTVAKTLKQLNPPPLILFLSVHGDPASRRQALAAGADGFVEKGAGGPALLSQIRQLLAD